MGLKFKQHNESKSKRIYLVQNLPNPHVKWHGRRKIGNYNMEESWALTMPVVKSKKKKVDKVVKAEAIIKAFQEKEKKSWVKISREAAKAGRGRLKKLKNQKRPYLNSIQAFQYKKNRRIRLFSWFL